MYKSKSAQLLRSVTAKQQVVWTPEAGWADESDSAADDLRRELADSSARRTQYHAK